MGLVDELVSTREELIPAAKKWIAAKAGEEVQQPWDVKGYKIPGGTPSTPSLAQNLPAFPANLRKQIKGANYPAPLNIMSAAVEGAQVDFDNASEIEGRYFVDLVTGQVAKNMIQAFFFDLQRATGSRGRPEEIEPFQADQDGRARRRHDGRRDRLRVAPRPASRSCSRTSPRRRPTRARSYSEKLVAKAVERGRSSQEEGDALLARITPTTDPAAAEGAELVIEAVFEDPKVKAEVFAEIEPHLAPDALLGSNTSTLPITEPGRANVSRPADFIGLHFFSPVDKMPLLEIIKGEQTSEETLYRALDVAKLIKKTPIVVNDSRGFFTSRVIGTFINEGIAMLLEGVPAPTIEQASSQAGYPAPVLQLSDELNLKLMQKIRNAAKNAAEAEGGTWTGHPAEAVIDQMLDEGRPGRLEGKGFYEYEDGKRTRLWPGLREAFPPVDDPAALSLKDLEERMLVIEAIETVKCLDEGVIETVADANIGSILGIGFPGWTGGVLQYINGYEDGLPGFVARARELAERYGERFEPPASLVEKAERGEIYSDEEALVST